MEFVKMHGIGNDYVYIDCFKNKVNNPNKLAAVVSDRHKGIGSDGLVLILPPTDENKKSLVRMRMFNSDGSESEMCGNAIRCVGKYVYENAIVNTADFYVETLAGDKHLTLELNNNNKVENVTVDMGKAYWKSSVIPVAVEQEECIHYPIEINGKKYIINCVSVGNPHAVIFMDSVDDVENLDIGSIGPLIENHSLFPKRINVEFVYVYDKTRVRMRVWERGAGETEACGTGACAVGLVCMKLGLTDNSITIALNGGDLDISLSDTENVFMKGGATLVFNGNLLLDK